MYTYLDLDLDIGSVLCMCTCACVSGTRPLTTRDLKSISGRSNLKSVNQVPQAEAQVKDCLLLASTMVSWCLLTLTG